MKIMLRFPNYSRSPFAHGLGLLCLSLSFQQELLLLSQYLSLKPSFLLNLFRVKCFLLLAVVSLDLLHQILHLPLLSLILPIESLLVLSELLINLLFFFIHHLLFSPSRSPYTSI
jgi:hypothetical protein